MFASIMLFSSETIKTDSSSNLTKETSKFDTLEFILNHPFISKCNDCCYELIGSCCINTINGDSTSVHKKELSNHLFVKCKTHLKLKQNTLYKYSCMKFHPNSCTNLGDTTRLNNYYYLVKLIK